MRMITLVTRHDRLLGDRLLADVTLIRTVAADGRSIREEKQVGVCRDSIVAFGTSKAFHVP